MLTRDGLWGRRPLLGFGALLLLAICAVSLAAPWIATHDPQQIDALIRLQGASSAHYLGTDALGRDLFSRAVWGGRISLVVAAAVAAVSTAIGVLLGLGAAFVRWIDGPIMRVMDGVMAIPSVLLASALAAGQGEQDRLERGLEFQLQGQGRHARRGQRLARTCEHRQGRVEVRAAHVRRLRHRHRRSACMPADLRSTRAFRPWKCKSRQRRSKCAATLARSRRFSSIS